MDKVVYFLGAGFSAGFGLPVMSNFLERAKDLYFSNREEYEDLGAVIEQINRYAVVKNTFEADLFNIEEVMSLLQIEKDLGNGLSEEAFTDFIVRVINESTPRFGPQEVKMTSNWYSFIFENSSKNNDLANFVANLIGTQALDLLQPPGGALRKPVFQNLAPARSAAKYGIITLNYDILLELVAEHICDNYDENDGFSAEFASPNGSEDPWETKNATLAKLHGCVRAGNIVPPTWKKGVNPTIEAHWRAAFSMIADANHIRIIGYSLAIADSYVKYLLKAAIVGNPNLKTITIVCHDPDGSVEARFREFIAFPKMVFVNTSTEEYLLDLRSGVSRDREDESRICFNNLEDSHVEFLKRNGFDPSWQ